jgi:hypothetical protein
VWGVGELRNGQFSGGSGWVWVQGGWIFYNAVFGQFWSGEKNSGIGRFWRGWRALGGDRFLGCWDVFSLSGASCYDRLQKSYGVSKLPPKKSRFSNFSWGTPNFRDFGPKMILLMNVVENCPPMVFRHATTDYKKVTAFQNFRFSRGPPGPVVKNFRVLSSDSVVPSRGAYFRRWKLSSSCSGKKVTIFDCSTVAR